MPSASSPRLAVRWRWFMGDSRSSSTRTAPLFTALFLPSLALLLFLLPLGCASAYLLCHTIWALVPTLGRSSHITLPTLTPPLPTPHSAPRSIYALPPASWPALLALFLLTDLLLSLVLATLAAAWLDIAGLVLRVVIAAPSPSPTSPRGAPRLAADTGTGSGAGGHLWSIVDAGVRGTVVCRVCGAAWVYVPGLTPAKHAQEVIGAVQDDRQAFGDNTKLD